MHSPHRADWTRKVAVMHLDCGHCKDASPLPSTPSRPRSVVALTPSRYPKIVEDLSNWQTRSVAGSNGAMLVAAETSTVSWGTSVAGELG